MITLAEILKDSNYKLTQFSQDKIKVLEDRIKTKEGKQGYFVDCLVRNKEIKLTPEGVISQLFLMKLTEELGYPTKRIELEYQVVFGLEKKRADICIFDKVCM